MKDLILKKKSKIRALIILMLIILANIGMAYAEETLPKEVETPDQQANLIINCLYSDGNEAIEGIELSIIKIGELKIHNKAAKYDLIPEISEKYPEIIPENMDDRDFSELAKLLSDDIRTTNYTEISDEYGKIRFNDLEYGLYLVKQTGRTGEAEEFSEYEPFIVSVPYPVYNPETDRTGWEYEVDVLPKTETVKLSPTPMTRILPNHPTGDDTDVRVLLFILSFSALILVLGMIWKYSEGDAENGKGSEEQ